VEFNHRQTNVVIHALAQETIEVVSTLIVNVEMP